MLRILLAVTVAIASAIGGYILGTIGAYRAAVVDYVENDAETIEKVAHSMYEDLVEPSKEGESIRRANESNDTSDSSESVEGWGFQ